MASDDPGLMQRTGVFSPQKHLVHLRKVSLSNFQTRSKDACPISSAGVSAIHGL